MRGGRGHHHGGPGGGRGFGGPGFGGPGFGGPGWGPGPGPFLGPPILGPPILGPPVGIWGGGRFRRRCPPPRYGYHGYYYNYPGLLVGTALVGGALVGAASARHHVYVRNRQQVTVINEAAPVRKYYVDIPEDIYPGETFRAVLDGEEVIITCPEISGPGERILVSVEQPHQSVAGLVQQQPVGSAQVVAPTATLQPYPSGTVVPPAASSAPPTAVPIASAVSYSGDYSGSYATAVPVNSSNPSSANNSAKLPQSQPSQPVPLTSAASAPPAAAAQQTAPPVSYTGAVPYSIGGIAALPAPGGAVVDNVASCPKCTYFNPKVAKFCQMCGNSLTA